MASRAFAVADHQIAHVYVRRPEDLDATREALADLPGIEQLLDDEGKKAHHLDHPRSGELVAVAEPDAWFTYYYWLDDARAPDFAQLVEIHRKPGYDPVELFMDPLDPYVKRQGGHGARPQEARHALPHGGRAPRPLTYSRQPRPPPHERRRRSAHPLLHPPRRRRPRRGHRSEVPARSSLAGLALTGHSEHRH